MANVKFTKEIDEQIVIIAKKYGLKPNDVRAIVQIESKGDPYASASNTTAEGLMQIVDRTGKEYGLIGDDKFDIIKNLDAGARLMLHNKNAFIKKFKREPTAGELYFAHQQGFTGASKILSVDKDANILTVPGMTDKKVLDNGGKTSMTAGEFADKWINKANKLANNMSVEYINVPLRTSNSQQARFLNTEKPKLRPDNLKIPEPKVISLIPQQTSIPQLRPDNLEVPVEPTVTTLVPQQTSIPQMRPDNLSIQEQEVPQPQSFGQAFSQARQQHGGDGGIFEWNGNKYTTDIAKEVPAVAEPMFPREEFVPTVPPRVTSTADSRINVPPFEGMEILDLGFNNGTNSVPMNFSGVRNTGTGEGITAMDAARFVAEATPIVGDAMAAKEIYDELQKDNPNYKYAAGLGALALVGIIPGVGDALKKGGRVLLDNAKRIEIDPNTLGMGGGNVSLKSKAARVVDDEVPISNFTTAHGSTYDVYNNSRTKRDRAARPSDAARGQTAGPQPKSGKTIYMSKENKDEFGPLFQNTEIPSSFLPLPNNQAKLVLREDFGPRPKGSDLTKPLDFSVSPEVGLYPVELYMDPNTGRTLFDNSVSENIHFGNEIIEVNSPMKKFNNGTNSVPGYNEGTGMISAMDSIAKMREQYVKDLLERSNQQRIETDAIDEDLAFAQPIPQANSNDSTFTKPVDGSMRFALNTATSLDNRYPIPLTQRQIDTKSNMYSKSIADGSYGDPQAGYSQDIPSQNVPVINPADGSYGDMQAGYSQEVPIIKNTADGSYGDPQAGYSQQPVPMVVNATPPGYDAGPAGTTIDAVPPGYNAVPQREPINDMVPGENTFVYNNGYQIKSDRFGVPEAVSPFRIDPEKMKKITKRYADNKISTEQYQLQKKEFDNAVYQDQAHKAYLSKLKEQKDIVSNEENLNSISILDQRIAEAKAAGDNALVAELEANKNKLLESTTPPEVKEEINLEDQFPTPGDDSMYEPPELTNTSKDTSPLVSETGLSLKDGVIVDAQGNPIPDVPPPPPEAKNKIEGLLKDYFGLEGKDIVKALGYYLMSRATGASHAGSMRWAGGVVLDSAAKREAKEDKLEAKTASDQGKINTLVKAGYTRASAEAAVKTDMDDLLVKDGTDFSLGQPKGDIKRIQVDNVKGFENQVIHTQTYKNKDGAEVEMVTFTVPSTNRKRTMPLFDFEKLVKSNNGFINTTPDTANTRTDAAKDYANSMESAFKEIISGGKAGANTSMSSSWAAGLAKYFDSQKYDLSNTGVALSLQELSLEAARIATQKQMGGKITVNRIDDIVKTLQLNASTMQANQSVWEIEGSKEGVPAFKIAELQKIMFEEEDGNLAEVSKKFLSFFNKFKVLEKENSEAYAKLKPNKNENKFYVYLYNKLTT